MWLAFFLVAQLKCVAQPVLFHSTLIRLYFPRNSIYIYNFFVCFSALEMQQLSMVVLALALGFGSAFMPASVKQSAFALKVTEDPWFPGTVSNFAPEPGLNTKKPLSGKQDFLEASPYYDQTNIPINTFKAKVFSI